MSLNKGIGYAGSGAGIGSAIAPGIGTAIGAGAGLLAGLFSDDGPDYSAQMKEAADLLMSMDIPDIDKAIALQQYQQSGTFSPEMMEKIQLEADKKTALTEDPQNRANQQMALNALKELSQTGMSAIDRAQMAEMRSQVAQDEQAKNAQILQEAQMRGQSGGGQQLASQLAMSQSGAQGASKAAMQQAAAAAQARQNALSQFGTMAGQVRSADVGTQQFNIQNELQRQRFLDQNSLARQQANIGALNQAQMANLQRQQQVADMNAQQQNQEYARQKQAQYQKAMMELERRKAVGDIYGKQSEIGQKQSAAEAGGIASMLEGTAKMATAGNKAGWWGGTGDSGVTDLKVGLSDDAKKSWKDLSDNWDSGAATILPARFNTSSQPYQYAAHGGRIDGHAKTDGDSYENDTVPAMLSPDEIVVPRSKAQDPKKAKTFIDEIFEQEKIDKKPKKKYDRNESILDLIAKLHSEKSK